MIVLSGVTALAMLIFMVAGLLNISELHDSIVNNLNSSSVLGLSAAATANISIAIAYVIGVLILAGSVWNIVRGVLLVRRGDVIKIGYNVFAVILFVIVVSIIVGKLTGHGNITIGWFSI